jgi:hypothetical protein
MIIVDTDVKNQLSVPALLEGNDSEILGTPANYPAGQTGRLFFTTNSNAIYYDNGTAWVQLIGGGSGGGGYVTLGTSQTITGAKTFDNNVFINSTYSLQGQVGSALSYFDGYFNSLFNQTNLINNGSIGIGATPVGTGASLFINKLELDGLNANGIKNQGTIQSTTTDSVTYYQSTSSTAAASFNLSNIVNFQALQGIIGLGSTVNAQYGFFASSTLIGANNNYGFFSQIPAGSNRWNFYAFGSAKNYFAGDTQIGSLTDNGTGAKLQITGNISYQNSFNRRTGNHTLLLTEQNKIVEMNVASANNLTIPQNSSVAFPI